MAVWRWLVLAFSFGTILPTPAVKSAEPRDLRMSTVFFPLVGLFLGASLWAVMNILRHALPVWPSTIIALAIYTLLTGALHLDGLMDLADGLGSRKERAVALEVMRDSRVGALGAVAGCIAICGKLAALANLPTSSIGPYLFIPLLSRLCMVLAMAIAPSARGGEGLGGLYARQIPAAAVISFVCVSIVVSWLIWPVWFVPAAFVAAACGTFLYAKWLTHRFGGMTGDMYGALNELVEWVGWLSCTG